MIGPASAIARPVRRAGGLAQPRTGTSAPRPRPRPRPQPEELRQAVCYRPVS